jgi:hypothetical protein
VSDSPLETLRQIYEDGGSSFFIQLRCHLHWDWVAFERLANAAEDVCDELQGQESVERWVAECFYLCATFIPDWTAHRDFPRPTPPERYQAALTRIRDVADRFFLMYRG